MEQEPMSGTHNEGKSKGAPRHPVDAKTRARVRKLAREGKLSRNAIAREVGISPSTVSAICAEARPPITFDRTASAVAVQARSVDLKARRQGLAERVLSEAIAQLDRMNQQHEVINWHEGMMNRDTIDQPTSGDVKNYATAAAILIDKHLVLIRHDSEGGELSGLDKFLAHLMPGGGETAA